MTDRYMTAQELEDALADTGHTLVRVDASERGTRRESIRRIELQLSNGRRIEIRADIDVDDLVELLVGELGVADS